MKNLKTKNGITLIALIITIIVMIILVAVTVSVALNGGIFQKAEDGSQKTMIATEKEQLIGAIAMARADDAEHGKTFSVKLPEGSTDKSTTKKAEEELKKDDSKWSLSEDGITFTSPNENTFTVDALTGKVSDPGDKKDTPKLYIDNSVYVCKDKEKTRSRGYLYRV